MLEQVVTPDASSECPSRLAPVWNRVTPAVVVVAANLAVWHIGVFLNSYGGWVDSLGAALCICSFALAHPLVFFSIVYSFYRRVASPVRAWDLYGPALAIISVVIITWEHVTSIRY